MKTSRRIPLAVALTIGLGLGWLGGRSTRPLHADGGDRWGESSVRTGPIEVRSNLKTGVQLAQDAVYHLNYATGKLLAMAPLEKSVGGKTRVLTDFAERDLIRDFDLPPGVTPHFLMTTVDLGSASMSAGWSPLLVFETTTGQVASYRVSPVIQGSDRPSFDLIERRADPRLVHPGGGR